MIKCIQCLCRRHLQKRQWSIPVSNMKKPRCLVCLHIFSHGVQVLTAGPVRKSKTLVETCETEHLYSWWVLLLVQQLSVTVKVRQSAAWEHWGVPSLRPADLRLRSHFSKKGAELWSMLWGLWSHLAWAIFSLCQPWSARVLDRADGSVQS